MGPVELESFGEHVTCRAQGLSMVRLYGADIGDVRLPRTFV